MAKSKLRNYAWIEVPPEVQAHAQKVAFMWRDIISRCPFIMGETPSNRKFDELAILNHVECCETITEVNVSAKKYIDTNLYYHYPKGVHPLITRIVNQCWSRLLLGEYDDWAF